MLLYYVFGVIWIAEFFTAMGQFVISYSTVLYYFCPKDSSGYKEAPPLPLVRGYTVGFVYHLGTIAFGSLIIAIIRLVRMILMYIAKQAEKEGNAILALVAKCLVCVVTCVKSCMEFLNKNAYMDVAIRSTWFCTAAKNALKMILSEAALMALLNGACFIFQIAGAGLISGGGAAIAYLTVTGHDSYTSDTSPYFVDNVPAVVVASFIVALTIAIPFMITFDMCADTLLYCFMVDKARPSGGHDYCPDQLRRIIHTKGGE